MRHTTKDMKSYGSGDDIDIGKDCSCLKGIFFALPFSVLMWILIIYFVLWLD